MKFSFEWSNAISSERRDIIFENRNKEYGGYAIRRDYQRHVVLALFFSLTGLGLIITTPLILSYFSEKKTVKRIIISEGIRPIDTPTFVSIIPPPPAIAQTQSNHKTTKFTKPMLVTAIEPLEQLPTQSQAGSVSVSTSTQSGVNNIVLPAETVVDLNADIPRIFVEEMPSFIGGEEKLFKYLSKIKYPAIARENGISGQVYVTFVIDKDGKIKDVKLLHGIGGGCDEEALKVIRNMPDWKPGRQNGQNVSVLFNLPVNFSLK